MQTFGSFLVSVLAASSFAAALPAADAPKGQKFSVTAKHNPSFKVHGPTALAKGYAKYNIPISAELAKAVSAANLKKRDQGSDPNSPVSGDVEYLAEVKIGTPSQTFNLDFDTGSADLWTFGTDTPKSQAGKHPLYDSKKSSTSKVAQGEKWKISYGDGSGASGLVYTDDVSVGGVIVKGQQVEIATTVTKGFTSDVSDGLLGLSYGKGNTVTPKTSSTQKTWFEKAMGSLDQPLFTANLKHNADGTYNFGYIDDSEHTGDIAYADVVSNTLGYWQFESSGYSVGDGDLGGQSFQGIADTGTTLMYLQTDIAQAYYAQVDGAQSTDSGYVFPCDANLPNFSFGVGQSTITVPSSLINMGAADDGGSSCFGGIQDGQDQNILGDVALKAALVVFDRGNNRVGWAQKDV